VHDTACEFTGIGRRRQLTLCRRDPIIAPFTDAKGTALSKLQDLLAQGVVLLDGAMGTELQAAGMPVGTAPEVWAAEHADVLSGVHRAYVAAGAQAILTCTFGGSRWKLALGGAAERVGELNRRLAEIAREAADGALVLGDIGPTGQMVAPLGTHERGEFVEVFAEQAAALAEGGVDAILIETMTDLTEATAAVEAAKRTALPVLASMSFAPDADGGGYHTVMGVEPAAAARALAEAGADAVGTNCGVGIEDVVRIVTALRAATELPILAEPNAGMPKLVDGKTVFEQTPEAMAAHVEALVAAGARIVGGCCGTTPRHIRAFAERIKL
jgi:5-methyltetrahydrofolate--homocysteine methyltransferase